MQLWTCGVGMGNAVLGTRPMKMMREVLLLLG